MNANASLAADFAGLHELFGEKRGRKATLRKVTAREDAPAAEVLKQTLAASFGRVVELFHEWDDDGSGRIDAAEFRRALPMFGLKVERRGHAQCTTPAPCPFPSVHCA